ncbi:MAG: hypothetical protein AAGH64_01420 [Planctomycetota bacterium]
MSVVPFIMVYVMFTIGAIAYAVLQRASAFPRCIHEPAFGARLRIQLVALWPLIVTCALGWYLFFRYPLVLLVMLMLPLAILGAVCSRLYARDDLRYVCGGCRYPRPSERDASNEVCPECGNRWWELPSMDVFRSEANRTEVGGIPELNFKIAKWYAVCLIACAFVMVPLLVRTWLIGGGNVADRYGVVSAAALEAFATDEVRVCVIGARISRGVRNGRNVDREFERFIEVRGSKMYVDPDVTNAIDEAVVGGLVSAGVLDRFYSEAFEYTLSLAIDPLCTAVTPELDLVAFADSNIPIVYALLLGVRVNEGPYVQATEDRLKQPPDLAVTFEDWDSLWPHGHYDTHLTRAQRNPGQTWGFDPIDIADLPAGEHRVKVRLFLYVLPEGGSHGYPKPASEGGVRDTDGLFWHETCDLTASFTIPASAR